MSTDICDQVENDEFYKKFLESDLTKDANINTASISFSQQIKKLSEGVELLSNELQTQVRQQHGALLSQASHAGKLTAALEVVNGHMIRLEAGAERLKAQINTPYALLESQTRVLARLHEASHLLRQAGQFLHLFRKLQASAKGPIVQATILYELEPLLEDEQLARVEFVREEINKAKTARQRLNNLANRDLASGLKGGKFENKDKVINALQIFSNLHTLSKCVDSLLDSFISDIRHSVKECFAGTDVSSLSSKKPTHSSNEKFLTAQKAAQSSAQNFRSKLWAAIDWLFDEEIAGYCSQIIMLESCLTQVSQPASDVLLFSLQNNDVVKRFWTSLEDLLRTSFSNCAIHVSQHLKQDLPKLLIAAHGIQIKFGQKFTFSDNVFSSLDAGYLEKCVINLKAPLQVDIPTQEAVDGLVRAASAELSAALVDNRLCLLVAAAFNACNKEFWTKIETFIKFGADSEQVVDIPNASQIQNTTLANIIFYHNEQVKRMIQTLGSSFLHSVTATKILDSLNHGTTVAIKIIQQLIDSIKSAANIILLTIHREPGLNQDKPLSLGPSLYMKELQEFLNRAWNLHIAPFTDKQILDVCGKELAERCIELFVRNLAIVRPISIAGRNRLKADCQHMEVALTPIAGDLTTLGKSFRLLRSISTLITLPAEDLAKQSSDSTGPVTPHLVLLLLFAHAGSDLASPHAAAGWANEKIISWLDTHTGDKERFELVTGALQKYRTIIRQKNIVQYDPVYPYISNYLEKSVQNIS